MSIHFTNRSVLYRLKFIIGELRKGSRTADQMAMALEVSSKTINRDIELLRNLGLSISSSREPGDQPYAIGYQLDPGAKECPLCSLNTIRRDPVFISRTSWTLTTVPLEYCAHVRSFLCPDSKDRQ